MSGKLFIGRSNELNLLKNLVNKKSSSLVVIHGRRRIGKSALVKEFAKNTRFFNFSGIPPGSETSAQSERDVFALQLSKASSLPELKVDDWSKLFSLLATVTQEGRVVILFDEISWMGSKDPDFLGKLKNAWDMDLSQNAELILILCGSVSTWIDANILSSTGFMGRISLTLRLQELSLSECNQFLMALGFKSTAHEKFKLLALMGGVPRYLEEIQPQFSADENIRNLCFTEGGVLYREFNTIFSDLFSKRSQYYKRILEILSDGDLSFTAVCEKLDVQKSGVWGIYLEDLEKAGFIKREPTWNLKTGEASRLLKFRLSDNYARFYLKYIEPSFDLVQNGKFNDAAISQLPNWDGMMGLQFENLVLNNRKLIWEQLKINPQDILMEGPYFQNKTNKHEGCQIDYLIKTRFNTLLACEVKFSKQPVSMEVINSMENKIKALAVPKNYACLAVLIHVNGVSSSVVDAKYFNQIIDFSSLL